ncbi:MAG: NAD(P)-dependent oxidoreductase, partial [Alphaproteobacteria bacterium]|nr:NAD(P)-dependent oxidoreductase [Alphaproteobacteria bacterium]
SYGDLARLMERCLVADRVGCSVIWGTSANARMSWWGKDARATLGWRPEDSADSFAAGLAARVSEDPIAERYQGGGFPAIDYSRATPPPARLFEDR